MSLIVCSHKDIQYHADRGVSESRRQMFRVTVLTTELLTARSIHAFRINNAFESHVKL